jgi:hypothetical protein
MVVGLRKQYRKTGGLRTVTFSLPKAGVASARAVNIVGDFNGSFSASVTLARGREYQFRYLLDGGLWENDWKADNISPTSLAAKTRLSRCKATCCDARWDV